MAAADKIVWDLEAHTRAKHEILRRYLQAWVPILSFGGFQHVLYIDGFAGPGRYSKGEPGSPIIALRAALDQRVPPKPVLSFLFVEKDPKRAEVLRHVVGELALPKNFRVKIAGGQTFEGAFKELHRPYDLKRQPLPPTFAFIDPFGWVGIPFAVVQQIARYRSSEVLVTFMYEEINRFIGLPEQGPNFDSFFGGPRWREGLELADARARNRFLHDLYLNQLRHGAGFEFVRSFEMRNDRDVTDYFLFFGTNSLLGLRKMKEAMWKVDESGEFKFSDATNPDQQVLFEKKPRFDILKAQILSRFAGKEVSVGEVESYVLAETAFRETHYKSEVLKPLELMIPPRLEVVNPPTGRRRGTYRDPSLLLRFLGEDEARKSPAAAADPAAR